MLAKARAAMSGARRRRLRSRSRRAEAVYAHAVYGAAFVFILAVVAVKKFLSRVPPHEPHARQPVADEPCYCHSTSTASTMRMQQAARQRLERIRSAVSSQHLQQARSASRHWNALFDATYIINLRRRPDRLQWVLRELNATWVDATRVVVMPATDYAAPATSAHVLPHLELTGDVEGQRLHGLRFATVLRPIANWTLRNRARDWRNELSLWPPNRSQATEFYERSTRQQQQEEDEDEQQNVWVSPIRPSASLGVAGCYHSHLEVLLHARRQGYETFLVLEDDVATHSNFHALLFEASARLPRCWDLLSLGWSPAHSPCDTAGGEAGAVAHEQQPVSQAVARDLADVSCGVGGGEGEPICRARGQMQNTAAILYHRRTSRWLTHRACTLHSWQACSKLTAVSALLECRCVAMAHPSAELAVGRGDAAEQAAAE